jgi:transmembrane sensor
VVDVRAPSLQSAIRLSAGNAAMFQPDGSQTTVAADRGPASPMRPPDWTEGRLSFDGARIDAVLAQANRYSRRQILIADPAIAAYRVTGVFRTGDPDGLAKSLATAFAIRLERDSAGNWVLRPRARN